MDKVQLQNRTKSFAVRVFKMVEKLPKSKGTEVIAYQLIKASSSVAANYRAVCRAKSKADFINKLKIVEEESDELVSIFTASLKTSKVNYKYKIPNRNS
jgi:four helix bundle protein